MQMANFQRAVDDVDGAERMAAYAWRYEILTGKKMNKKSAARIFKKLNMKKTW